MFLSLVVKNVEKIKHKERIPKNCLLLSPSTKTFEKGLRVAGTLLYMLLIHKYLQNGKFAFMWQKELFRSSKKIQTLYNGTTVLPRMAHCLIYETLNTLWIFEKEKPY